jgi:phosphoribosylformylglycinamidine cyclo-ligase
MAYDYPSPFGPGQLGRGLLAPTRIYVKPLLTVLKEPGLIKGIAHITGGGLLDNIPRMLPAGLAARISLSAIPVPPVFAWLAAAGPIAEAEMVRTFNCGVGMAIIVPEDKVERVSEMLAAEGETVFRLGQVESRREAPIVFDGSLRFDGA